MSENNRSKQTMTQNKNKLSKEEIKSLMEKDLDFLKPMVRIVMQEVLEVEMSEIAGTEKGECTEARQGYRSGYSRRSLVRRARAAQSRPGSCPNSSKGATNQNPNLNQDLQTFLQNLTHTTPVKYSG